MRGPIDYIVVGFEGNKFDGSILKAIFDAVDQGSIALVGLTAVQRDENDEIKVLDITESGDEYLVGLLEAHKPELQSVNDDDVAEVADLIAKNSTAGLLIVEQLWAKPLKAALIKANGVLLAEGRIHPEAALELES